MPKMQHHPFLPLMLLVLITGCGNSINCALLGDNVKGHITFASTVPIQPAAPLIVEWSKDSFSTVSGRNSLENIHGLAVVPYSACVDNDVSIQLRAYQDANSDLQISTGEYYGRHDNTGDGNASYANVNVPSTTNKSNWQVSDGTDITLDSQQ